MMVEVFKTNVKEVCQAAAVRSLLNIHLPACKINFDLQDCDNILRIEGEAIPVTKIITLLAGAGFDCALLD